MDDRQLKELLERYREGVPTDEDKAFLESWYLTHNQSLSFEMDDDDKIKDLDEVWASIHPVQQSRKLIALPRLAAAASILICLCTGGYFLLHQKKQTLKNSFAQSNVIPGKNKATLTLANGKKIVLNAIADEKLAAGTGIMIHKTKTGQLIYVASAKENADPAQAEFNTLTTSNGEQYQVLLPDGSHVWLNAASSLKYPVAFNGKERVVQLSGEAYFEVVHNPARPFKVKTQQQEVEVLGTHFNINAYDDEKTTKTTLAEGSVKVSTTIGNKHIVIKPGQQSQVNQNELSVQSVDIDEILAWKNGYFEFNEESFGSIMKKVARWYDVEIEYEREPADVSFYGEISRSKNISEVLSALSKTGKVHFRLEGKKLTVL